MTATASPLSSAAELAALRASQEFASDTQAIIGLRVPFIARVTVQSLVALIAICIVLAIVMPVERVVSARGRVAVSGQRIMIQPYETSVVRSIDVKPGQSVKAGDVLATLDPTFSEADLSALKRSVASLSAEVARLKAESEDVPYKPAGDDLYSRLQLKIYNSRRAQYTFGVASYDGKIASQKSQIDDANKQIEYFQQRLDVVSELEGMKNKLAQKQVGSRADLLNVAAARIDVQRSIAQAQGGIDSANHELAVLEVQLESFKEKWLSDIDTQLVDRQGDLERTREQLAKADKRADLVQLKAPQDAVVLDVADFSVGSVIESAKQMIALVPSDAPLEVEAEITTTDQGFVTVGQPVDLKFDAWPSGQHGSARGVVRSISADTLNFSDKSGAASRSVYLARIDVQSTDLKKVPSDFRLVPGMTLTADIMIGDHTVAEYLVDRAVPTLTEGFREP
jgi:HlyD family secretion protein